jgi:hypothetical protein
MDECNGWGYQHASDDQRNQLAEQIVDQAWDSVRPRLVTILQVFLAQAISPRSFYQLEMALLEIVRELGRSVLQATLQSLEPADHTQVPKNILFQAGGYRRRSDRTPNRSLATRFGMIILWRTGYRSWTRGEETIFPLELILGLVENVSPAMLDLIGKTHASTGQSQKGTLDVVREQTGDSMGVKRLRACIEELAERLDPLRQKHQVDSLVAMIDQANQSGGSRKPVLSVGRDGINLGHRAGYYEVATTATVSVIDRRGKRLGTIYLAHPPEPGQGTMDSMLTELLNELFERYQGQLPRLAYVTDSGSQETDYFNRVLHKMKHPITGKKLDWIRVADFYHVSERVWAMADALFSEDERDRANAWAKRMLKELKRHNGASRVLHSAASLVSRRNVKGKQLENFWKAYNYLRKRTQYMKYAKYAHLNIPLGSGITEAGCKTVYTQRLKLSGMRWSHEGAQQVLTLRTILLSGTWQPTFEASLDTYINKIRPYAKNRSSTQAVAA